MKPENLSFFPVADIVARYFCECGALATHMCGCGQGHCDEHGYDSQGGRDAKGVCCDCSQVQIYEQFMEATYGRADA